MSVNRVILVGYVGADPDIRYVEQNHMVATLRLATTERATYTAKGQMVPEHTEWHNVKAWNQVGRFCEKYVKKGSHLYVEGKIRYSNYVDKAGVARYTTDIYAEKIELLDRRADDKDNTSEQVAEKGNIENIPDFGEGREDKLNNLESGNANDGLPF